MPKHHVNVSDIQRDPVKFVDISPLTTKERTNFVGCDVGS